MKFGCSIQVIESSPASPSLWGDLTSTVGLDLVVLHTIYAWVTIDWGIGPLPDMCGRFVCVLDGKVLAVRADETVELGS